MLLESYEFNTSKPYKRYDFYSEGPKGRIRKVVLYSLLGQKEGIKYYNLGFGDYDKRKGKINDLTVSNNDDRNKILTTVAMTAIEFTDHHRHCKIVVEGSTPARTRLYQMGIAKYYHEISEVFDIQGLIENKGLEAFQTGNNYLAFLASRK